jgi:transcriptional regulator with XRE-family HTH domain
MVLIYGDPIDPNKNATEKELGARIKELRMRRLMTQEVLAERAGLASDTVRRAERGEFSASYRTLRALATGLAVPVHVMMRDDLDASADLAEMVRALPEHEFRIAVEIVRVLTRLAVGQPDDGQTGV